MKLTDNELDKILAESGLCINQPYSSKQSYRKDEYIFTLCLECGTEAHYRLKYILDKKDATCRACVWRSWYSEANDLYDESVKQIIASGISRKELIKQGVIKQPKDIGWSNAAKLAEEHGYNLVDLLRGRYPGNDVMVVQCKACGRQTAERPCDVEYGCTCNKSKIKGPGISFGSEVVEVKIPPEDRAIAPRTPSAKGLERWLQHQASGQEAYTFEQLKEMVCADIPELVAAWNDVRDPFEVPASAGYGIHLTCEKGHHPTQTPSSFLTNGCMVCRELETKANQNKACLDVTNPELAAEWDFAIDGDRYTPNNVGSGSKRKVQWKCIACGETWVDTVRNRELRMNNRCPHCGKVMGSLAWKYPEIARIWSPNNPISPWNTKPFGNLEFKPEWVCPNNPDHVWTQSTQSIIKKNGECPYCE